jgi:hypothetical protein
MTDSMSGGTPYLVRVDPEIQRLLQPGDVIVPSDDDTHAVFCRRIEDEEKVLLLILAVARRSPDDGGEHVYRPISSIPDGVTFSDMVVLPKN